MGKGFTTFPNTSRAPGEVVGGFHQQEMALEIFKRLFRVALEEKTLHQTSGSQYTPERLLLEPSAKAAILHWA